MPSATIEHPFPLAQFTTSGKGSFSVACCPADSSPPGSAASDIESATDIDAVVITVQGEGVHLYNTNDQKCIRSWSTPPGLILSSPAKYHTKTPTMRHVYAVVAGGSDVSSSEEHRLVWCWHDEEEKALLDGRSERNFARKTTKKFGKRIYSLEISPCLPSHIILINQDGSISLVSDDLKRVVHTCERAPTAPGAQLKWSYIFSTTSSCVPPSILPQGSTMILTVTATEGEEFRVHFFGIDSDRNKVNNLATVRIEEENKPLAFNLDPTSGQFSVLCSDGSWKIYQIQFLKSGQISLTEILSIPLRGFSLVSSGSVSVAPLKGNYLALSGARKQEGSDKYEHTLTIWDVRYGTLQAEAVIPSPSHEYTTHSQTSYQLTVLPNSHLVLAITTSPPSASKITVSKTSVFLCPYFCAPLTLLGAMNRMRATADYIAIKPAGLVRSGMEAMAGEELFTDADPDKLMTMWKSKIEQVQQREEAVLTKLMNKDDTPTVKEFASVFMEYVEERIGKEQEEEVEKDEKDEKEETEETEEIEHASSMEVDGESKIEGESKVNGIKEIDIDKKKKEPLVLSQYFVRRVAERCFAKNADGQFDSSFWPSKVVKFLIHRQLISSSLVDGGIIPALLERRDWGLIKLALTRLHDIPEADMIMLLQRVIALHQSKSHVDVKDFLSLIIAAPRNDYFMQQALHQLTVEELGVVLSMLIRWLETRTLLNGLYEVRTNKEFPVINDLLDFLALLLDTHFPTLILTPSLHPSLNYAVSLVQKEVETCNQLQLLQGPLALFERKSGSGKDARKATSAASSGGRGKASSTSGRKSTRRGFLEAGQGVPEYGVEVLHL
ncbi:uncharacterized protein VTP21DRAFT_10545 [Calcarisporiella thermophila]|uniref:uncharacterized protein n=1 Tax=Calcarisporiella thermophila TaxID=911321 RepID=UPI003741FADD